MHYLRCASFPTPLACMTSHSHGREPRAAWDTTDIRTRVVRKKIKRQQILLYNAEVIGMMTSFYHYYQNCFLVQIGDGMGLTNLNMKEKTE